MPQPSAHHTDSLVRGQARFVYWLSLGLASLGILSACASVASVPPARPAPVWITNAKSITILPTAALGGTLEIQQQIEGDFQGQSYVMQTVIDADERHFSLYALNAFGTQVFELQYDSQGIRYTSGLPIGNFKSEYLMADWQLCFFPTETVRAMIEAAGLAFTETDDGTRWRRTVADGAKPVIEIQRGADGVVHFRNLLRGYAYHITQGN